MPPGLQVVTGGQRTSLDPTATTFWPTPPPPPPAQTLPRPPTLAPPTTRIISQEEQEQAALDLKLRVTNFMPAPDSDVDITSQVVSFLSAKMGVPSTDIKITVETPSPHDHNTPRIITCKAIDSKRVILRRRRNKKGNVRTWIEPCLTLWQLAERRKKTPWLFFLRQQGFKAFFHSHRLMKITEEGMTEVTLPPC